MAAASAAVESDPVTDRVMVDRLDVEDKEGTADKEAQGDKKKATAVEGAESDNSRSQTIFGSFAPSQSLRRLVRQGEVAHPQNSVRTAAHVTHTQRKTVATLDSPLQVACALALNTKAEDAKRQRWAPRAQSGAYQAGWRGVVAGGGAPEVCAGPRLSLCSVPAAYSRRRGRGWGRWGPRAFASWVRLARS